MFLPAARASTAASLPMKSLFATSCFVLALADRGDGRLRQASISAAFEPHGAGPLHGGHQSIEDLLDDEDLLLRRCTAGCCRRRRLDDAAGGAIEVGRFVDDHGRIARPGHDRPLRLLHGRPGHGRPAGNADQIDVAMLEQGVGRFSSVGSVITHIRLSMPRSR